MRRRHGLAVLAVCAALAVSGCGAETDATTRPGPSVAAAGDVTGTEAQVVVPTGQLTIHVGDTVDRVAADRTARRTAFGAPADGSVLPVGISFDQGVAPLASALAFPAKPTSVSVRACGRDYPVADAYEVGAGGSTIAPATARGYYVGLGCAPKPGAISVVVSYGGVEQVVTADTGTVASSPADGLAALGVDPAPRAACPTAAWDLDAGRLSATVDCTVSSVYRTPFVPDQGWAADGEEWLVLDVDEIRLLTPELEGADGSASYTVVGIDDASSVGGSAAVQTLTQQPPPRDYVAGGRWVFAVPSGSVDPVRVDLTFRLRIGERTGSTAAPDTATVHVTGELTAP